MAHTFSQNDKLHWYLANGVLIDDEGNISLDEITGRNDEAAVVDGLIHGLWDVKSMIMQLEMAKDALETAIIERMEKAGEKSILSSDKSIRVTVRRSTYPVQNVHDFVTDIQSRKDEISKEVLIEILHAAKSFDANAIPSRFWRELLELYTEHRNKKPSITVAKVMSTGNLPFKKENE